jgi:phage portal protein BeeE
MSVDDYIELVSQYANGYTSGGVQQSLAGEQTEKAANNFVGLAQHAFGANGVVFACMLVRQLVFSSIRFRYQRLQDGAPSKMFGDTSLSILEKPWVGGTTQDLLSRMIQDADLAGNSYWIREGNELVRLRPDWVDIVVTPRLMRDGRGQIGWKKAGYVYTTGGDAGGNEPVGLLPDEVVHFAPIADPLANFRGMSWLTPILREIQADESMTRHRRKFFDNGATPNMIIKHDISANEEKVKRFAQVMKEKHGGTENAYKTLHLYPGADATVVGKDFRQIDFKGVQGAGETRIAAAAGVPPVIVGLSEGLAAATYSNYGQARRRLADGTAHPLWQNTAGSLELIMPNQGSGTRLWYDATDVPFLREDEKDAAEIAFLRAQTIRQLVDGGYTPESAVAAVDAGDIRLLVHSGFLSVQLQKPGATKTDAPAEPAPAPDPPPQD